MRTLFFLAAFFPTLLPCTWGLPVAVALASDIHHSSPVKQLIPQAVSKDVAVTSIAPAVFGPPFVNEGDSIVFNVAVSNNGSEEETFALDLRDDTEDKLISSQQLTLTAGDSKTVSISWDTTGASGGPTPPNPTFPGAVHIITATATLDGDSNESNNSKSFDQPGIYVIAAPKAPEISFPEKQEEPEGRTTGELPSAAPSVDTIEESLAEMYVSTVAGQQSGASGNPSIQTAPTSLTQPYKTEVESDEGSAIAKPAIATVAEPLTRVSSAATGAKLDEFLSTPGVATTADALNGIFLYQPEPNSVAAVSGPGVSTSASDLLRIFAASVDAREDLRLIKSDFDGGVFPPPRIVPGYTEGSVESSLGTPGMTTRKSPLFVIPTWPTTNDAQRGLGCVRFRHKGRGPSGCLLNPNAGKLASKSHGGFGRHAGRRLGGYLLDRDEGKLASANDETCSRYTSSGPGRYILQRGAGRLASAIDRSLDRHTSRGPGRDRDDSRTHQTPGQAQQPGQLRRNRRPGYLRRPAGLLSDSATGGQLRSHFQRSGLSYPRHPRHPPGTGRYVGAAGGNPIIRRRRR